MAEVLGEQCPTRLERVGLLDTFAETGQWPKVMEKYGMGTAHIAAAARRVLDYKRCFG